MNYNNIDDYFYFLKDLGCYCLNVDGINWFEYKGFMMPAYLPHCAPDISRETASRVFEKSGKLFVRWDTGFGQIRNSQWWYVLRRKPWSIQEASRNTRSKIRRGLKKFVSRVHGPYVLHGSSSATLQELCFYQNRS